MMEPDRDNRYNSFSEVKEAISSRDFSTLEINEVDKSIYQNFSNALMQCLSCFTSEKQFVSTPKDFSNNIKMS